jgi:DNA segregation ATPase FtsK/SpoIIIE, S-DNA-T family
MPAEVTQAPAPKPRARKRHKKSTPAPTGRHADVEAVGLVLFGIAMVAAFTVLAPPSITAFSGWQKALRGALGWGMYYVPLPFLVFGGLMLLKRRVGLAARVLLGVLVMVTAGLLGTGLFDAKAAGSWASSVIAPMKVVTPLALVLIGFLASLGLEISLGWRRTRIARAAARFTSLGMLTAASVTGAAAMRAKDATQRLNLQISTKRTLEGAQRDLNELLELFEGSSDLMSWSHEVERGLEALPEVDDAQLTTLRDEAAKWRSKISAFTQARGKDLGQTLTQEDAGALKITKELKKQLNEAILSQNGAAKALEMMRRQLQLEVKTIEDAHHKSARERDSAKRALGASLRPVDLRSETERHQARLELGAQSLSDAEALAARVAPYTGWNEFVARLDQREEPEVQAFTANLETALKTGDTDVLPELANWSADLDKIERDLQEGRSTIVWDMPISGESADNASFEITNVGHLETVNIALPEDSLPWADPQTEERWVSPAELAAQKMEAAARLQQNTEKHFQDAQALAPGIADSGVGERLRFDPSKAVGAIPIQVPSTAFLDPHQASSIDMIAFDRAARERGATIDETFKNFGVNAKVLTFARGPTVTRFEVEPAPGEKIARIASLQNDLARVMAVGGIRIEAPVPGKSVVGIEVPNVDREPITFRTGIESKNFSQGKHKLPLLLGKSIDGEMVIDDLARMPHLLIAGSTGSGKSVCVNTLIMSLLYRYLPTQMRFVMIDPKMVELTPYDGIPHLVRPVVTNPNDAAGVLLGCVAHMERRYKMMSEIQAKNLEQYNEKARAVGDPELPYLVIIIDELADLMITSPKEVESSIMRLAQMARATGMHLILATQRPSADVLTGLIKVNVPARIAFAVSSGIDSRTILDSTGAERLTGNGDMLFYRPGLSKATRLQGPYISENELGRITEFLRKQHFEDDFGENYGSDFDGVLETSSNVVDASQLDFSDPFIKKAAEVVVEEGYAAVSRLQRRLSVGHARAGKLIDALEAMGIVGPYKGSKSREVLVGREQLPEFFGRPS